MAKKKNRSSPGEELGGSGDGQVPHASSPNPTGMGSPVPGASSSCAGSASKSTSGAKGLAAQQPASHALIICRNKHWRYISSFHGPWLQLPPEILEALANVNYYAPRPRPIDPAVFFDLVKIRRCVDEATDLTVRAANGVVSSHANSVHHHTSALGLGFGIGGGGTMKLSRERRHRLREQATQKLSKAYHLDEIACSVATMQSASTLEDVASLVLQRNNDDPDAKYVHFFHEKIPSRQLAECTSLAPLDQIIVSRPTSGEPLRTRAIVRIFKDDLEGAAVDLTTALQVHRFHLSHRAGRNQVKDLQLHDPRNKGFRRGYDTKLEEDDQPSSLEPQLLFQRAGVYLSLACQHVDAALPDCSLQTGQATPLSNAVANKDIVPLEGKKGVVHVLDGAEAEAAPNGHAAVEFGPACLPSAGLDVSKKRLEAQKVVKAYAKRALRDYMAFVSHFDYSPDLPVELPEDFARKVNVIAHGMRPSRSQNSRGDSSPRLAANNQVPHKVYELSELFAASPPSGLPLYPAVESQSSTFDESSRLPSTPAESVTYHPLLADALHSLLLCHSLVQTSAKELLRHSYMVSRLVRLTDGYPVFQASRSPARADWMEIIRKADNWIQLEGSWEKLCSPAPLPALLSQTSSAAKELPVRRANSTVGASLAPSITELDEVANSSGHATPLSDTGPPNVIVTGTKARDYDLIKEQVNQWAILDAFESENDADRATPSEGEASDTNPGSDGATAAANSTALIKKGAPRPGHASKSKSATVTASSSSRRTPALSAGGAASASAPRRWTIADGREYPIITERAAAVARWVREAPPGAGSALGGTGGTSRRKKKPKRQSVAAAGSSSVAGAGATSATEPLATPTASVTTLASSSADSERADMLP